MVRSRACCSTSRSSRRRCWACWLLRGRWAGGRRGWPGWSALHWALGVRRHRVAAWTGRSAGWTPCAATRRPTSWPTAGRRSACPASRRAPGWPWACRGWCWWATWRARLSSSRGACGASGGCRGPTPSPSRRPWACVISPHAWVYDATLLLPALGVLAARAARRGWPWQDRWWLAAAFGIALLWPLGGVVGVTADAPAGARDALRAARARTLLARRGAGLSSARRAGDGSLSRPELAIDTR